MSLSRKAVDLLKKPVVSKQSGLKDKEVGSAAMSDAYFFDFAFSAFLKATPGFLCPLLCTAAVVAGETIVTSNIVLAPECVCSVVKSGRRDERVKPSFDSTEETVIRAADNSATSRSRSLLCRLRGTVDLLQLKR